MQKLIITFLTLIYLGCLSSSAQRVNADGRKMVKTVRVYEWRSTEYKLQEVFTMEYNGRNELVKLYDDKCNGFPPLTYTRNMDTILGKNRDLSECKYQTDDFGKIISGEIHEYINGKIANPDPYYSTLTFEYNDDGQVCFMTSKLFYHKMGNEYKESIDDRDYLKFDYQNGGTFSMRGSVGGDGKDYLVKPNNITQRYYDNHMAYDINVNIEALTTCPIGYQWYIPMFTEWCPTYPKYWLNRLDYGSRSREWFFAYDEKGNVITIDMPYSDGDPNMRYEIEYEY